MGKEVDAQARSKSRTVAMAVAAALLLVLFVAGFAFTNSVGAGRVASNASDLHWTNAALGTSSLTRAALVQASTFAGLAQQDLVDTTDYTFARDQVQASISELKALEATGETHSSHSVLSTFIAQAESIIGQLEAGEVSEAESALLGGLEASYVVLIDSLGDEQVEIQESIIANTESAATLNSIVLFILTLAIPGVAVGIYWWTARRQVKEYKLKSELELEAERDISRAKDGFIAGLSHELRTPLTSIYGFAEILTDGGVGDPEQTAEVAQIIANESAEMTRMVDDLLTASRMESTGIEIESVATRVNDIVESAVTPFERAGLPIQREHTDEMVVTDGARLRHVLVNLISNAARHGGENIGIEVSAADGTVDIEVWDDGEGVPEDQIENLFERFVHSGSEPLLTGSVGLGLAVASRLTTMLGGKLAYQRFAGKTYFIVNVPAFVVDQATQSEGQAESVADKIRAMMA